LAKSFPLRMLLAVPLLLAACCSMAAVPRWSLLADTAFQNFTQEHGLPGQIATALAEDGDGFLWVGTQAGLARWDGYRFRVYRPQAGVAGKLPDNWVQALHTDPRGRLWIGTNSGGLARYDRDSDRFVTYPAGPKGLSHGYVHAIADDGEGGLWIGTDAGLDHLAPDSGALSHFRHDAGDDGSLPGNRISAIVRDRGGALWVGTQAGLVRRAPGAKRFEPVALPSARGQVEFVRSLVEDGQGRIWAGTMGHGAYVIAADARSAQQLASSDPGQPLGSDRVLAIAADAAGAIWLGTYSSGVVVVDPATLATRHVRHDPAVPTSVGDDMVWAFVRQRSGLMWVATNRGISRYDPGQDAALTIYGGSSRKDSISDPNVTSVLPMADGQVWLGLAANGIDIVDPMKRRTGALRPGPDPETSLPKDFMWNMAAAPSGDVYLGSLRGLYRVERNGNGLARLALERAKPGASVDALCLAGSTLWMGSWADGLWALDVGTKGATRVLRHEGAEKLGDRRINSIECSHGALWIGTANGLVRFDAASGAVERIVPDAAAREALPAGSITSLLFDRQGRLWISTLGGGIAILDPQAQPRRFRRIGSKDRLPNDSVDKLLLDQAGNVWASTDEGVARIDSATLATRALGREDGFQIPAYWGGAGAVTPDGEMLFGGGGGLTVVRPDLLKQWDFRPPVVITDARVGEKAALANRFNSRGASGALLVQPDGNSLAIEFSALDYSAPERNRYAYRLEGFDRDWIDSDTHRRLAAYTNLPPGDYTLHLRGSNRSGVWSEPELLVPVSVLPAWYQTLWFRLLCAMAALLAVTAVVQLRTAYLRRIQRQLEQKVAERTCALQATTVALEEKSRALEEASLTDPLTGLRNRRFLTMNLDADINLLLRQHQDAQTNGSVPQDADLIFFLVDIDHFKQVNDTYGHAAGDAVLVQMRERLQRVFRTSDYVIRWGGEEFLAVARATSRTLASELAERIRTSVGGQQFELPDGLMLHKTCSVGYASFPLFVDAPAQVAWPDIVDLSDGALYTAKRAGRNAWVGAAASHTASRAHFIERTKHDPRAMAAAGELTLTSNLDADTVLAAVSAKSDH
jgi:diguanylate cyclase (GGDEF)-like protein